MMLMDHIKTMWWLWTKGHILHAGTSFAVAGR